MRDDPREFTKAPLLLDVMSRVRTDVNKLLSDEAALKAAARECVRCRDGAACLSWIQSHEEGDGHPIPEHCKVREFLRTWAP